MLLCLSEQLYTPTQIEGAEWVFGSTDLALKSMDCGFSGKSRGLTDFENTVDRGSAVDFGAVADCVCRDVGILGPKRNLDNRCF